MDEQLHRRLLGREPLPVADYDLARDPENFAFAKPHLPPKGGWTRPRLIEAAKQAAEELGTPLTMYAFIEHVGIHERTIYRKFPLGFHDLLDEAGLEPASPGLPIKWSEDQLLADYGRIAHELGRYPTVVELDQLAEASAATYRLRLGRKGQLIKRYEEWVAEQTERDRAHDDETGGRIAGSGPEGRPCG